MRESLQLPPRIEELSPGRTVIAIACVDLEGGIGNGQDLLFNSKEDMRRFKNATMGHICIMGLNTYNQIGKALPGRFNIVMCPDPSKHISVYDFAKHTYIIFASSLNDVRYILDERLPKDDTIDFSEIFVIGGESMYNFFAPYYHYLYLDICAAFAPEKTHYFMKSYWDVENENKSEAFKELLNTEYQCETFDIFPGGDGHVYVWAKYKRNLDWIGE